MILLLSSLINFKKLLLQSKKNHVGTRGAWAPARGLGTPPMHTWRLGYASVSGTPQRTRGAWAPTSVLGTPCAQVVLRLPAFGLGTPKRTRGAWAALVKPWSRPIGDKWCFGHGYRLKGNGLGVRTHDQWSSVRTQFYWVLHQNSTFLGHRILKIIICFRNIIIFIIINIINKIIYKFERKYYYLSYKFLWYFL